MNDIKPTPGSPPPTLPDDLFESPVFLPRDLDLDRREVLFLRMHRDTYVKSSFLDRRALSVDGNVYAVPLGRLVQAFRDRAPTPRPLNVIFHTAFCGSTLLSRCLDLPGQCLVYREPSVLHQLCLFKRYSLAYQDRPTPFLSLVVAMLGRTFEATEVPVIKPSDSCLNLAPELLGAQKASAGLFLYARLEAFLLSMLKNEKRRGYVRGMVERARQDLDRLGLFPGLDAGPLSDAQAAGFVWLGLMYPYLALLEDERLRVKSLDAALFFARPYDTLTALARHFRLSLPEAHLQEACAAVFSRHAKRPNEAFDLASYTAVQAQIAEMLDEEIRSGLAWVAAVTEEAPIPAILPRPLLG